MDKRQEKYMKLYKYAQMCWASYSTGLNEGMFGENSKGKIKQLDKEEMENLPTYFQALTENYMLVFDKYNVSFSKAQAREFINRYEVLAFEQDKNTGFSATLFKDTAYNDELILAIRGIDIFSFDLSFWNALKAGVQIFRTRISMNYYMSLLRFYDEKLKNFIENKKVVVTGHSFGGYLAQLFALSFPNKIKALYTYNALGVVDNEFSEITNFIGDTIDKGAEFAGVGFNEFDKNMDNIRLIPITQELKDSIRLENQFIAFSGINSYRFKEFIPTELQQENFKEYSLQYLPYNKEDLETNAAQLVQEIRNAPLNSRVLFKQESDYSNGHYFGASIFTLSKESSIGVENLIKHRPKSDKELPQELQQSEIYRIYTVDLSDTKEFTSQFGNHILASENIQVKLNVLKMEAKLLGFDEKKTVLKLVKSIKWINWLNWFFLLISIEDICEELLVQSRIRTEDENSIINCHQCGYESLLLIQ